jgi:uncharacterized RmlC-like cupin family protein
MSDSSAIRIIHPREFDRGTLQTPGSERLAAVAPQLGVETTLWGGLFEVKQGARTGIHHHGEQQTIAYVLSGICKVRWGANGEIRSQRKGRRFHSRSGVPAAHGDQSVRFTTVPMGRGEKHVDSDRGQSSGGRVAIVFRRPERGRRLGVWR